MDKLALALDFTIRTFVKRIQYQGREYFGAHYFSNQFADPYIEPHQLHESAYNLEPTAGLILGLHKFCEANPKSKFIFAFENIANRMCKDMQIFVRNHGFMYATKRIKHVLTQLQSSTAAVWYLEVCHYYHEKLKKERDGK